jgi:hypothetical protein
MAQELDKLWERRLELQRWPLVGGNDPKEDGNGYHDQISFDFRERDLCKPYSLNYRTIDGINIYFSNLISSMNPVYFSDNGVEFQNSIQLEQCSDGYRETFFNYLLNSSTSYRKSIPHIIGNWTADLVRSGKVIHEFVSWKDMENSLFYAFEIKKLHTQSCTFLGNRIIYGGRFLNTEGKKVRKYVNLPLKKCIVIEWPKELGGYSSWKKKMKSIQELDGLTDLTTELIVNDQPGLAIDKMKKSEIEFASLINEWGTRRPHNELSEFVKVICFFRYTETIISCLMSAIQGIRQVVSLLNDKLEEKAVLSFDNKRFNLSEIRTMRQKWMRGDLSFNEATEYLKRFR